VYKVPSVVPFLPGGVYSAGSPLPLKTIEFLFYNSLYLIDLNAVIKQPELLFELYSAVSGMIQAIAKITKQTSSLFLNRFPAASFLKFIGGYIICLVRPTQPFDQAFAVNVDSIISILSFFERNEAEEFFDQLCAILLQAIETERPLILMSFLGRASDLFCFSYKTDSRICRNFTSFDCFG
jgi:hypothetical protein